MLVAGRHVHCYRADAQAAHCTACSSLEKMDVLIAKLCLLVVLATSRTVCGTSTYVMTLDLRDRVITVEPGTAGCREDPLCELPSRAIDGNISTSWNSPVIEGGGSVNLSLELGQVSSLEMALLCTALKIDVQCNLVCYSPFFPGLFRRSTVLRVSSLSCRSSLLPHPLDWISITQLMVLSFNRELH